MDSNQTLFTEAQMKKMLMGPNSMKITEDLCSKIALKPGMRVLDLGCGTGLSSMFLANQYDVTVFATDLWIPATENYQRFINHGFGDTIIPIHADANDLPFADDYFDAVVSVDSYHYYGRAEGFFQKKVLPLLKPDGIFAISAPGLKEEYHRDYPPELLISWKADDLETMHSIGWWQTILATDQARFDSVIELPRFEEYWNDWLSCDNPYAAGDRASMNAGAGKYMNMIAITGSRVK